MKIKKLILSLICLLTFNFSNSMQTTFKQLKKVNFKDLASKFQKNYKSTNHLALNNFKQEKSESNFKFKNNFKDKFNSFSGSKINFPAIALSNYVLFNTMTLKCDDQFDEKLFESQSQFVRALIEHNEEEMNYMIEEGFDINQSLMVEKDMVEKDGEILTPIYLVIILGDIKMVEFLIKNKAHLNIQNEKGETPLDVALTMYNGFRGLNNYYEIAILLVKSGAYFGSTKN